MATDDRRDAPTALAEDRARVLGQIDEDEVVRLAMDLVRIPSFTTEETPCAEWLASYLDGYAGNDTTHLWAAGIPCCVYGPLGGYTDYHDVYTYLDELFTVTRVLASTALEATTVNP
jgi:acetylornithine deacetylase/succinyl-diaminopimelate desuccinylase-like protein